MTDEILTETEKKMKRTMDTLRSEFAAIRSGRANAAILDHVRVEAYGSSMPINQLATVTVPDARTLMIQPWDKNTLGDIEKAIQKSDLGLNPANDGQCIRLTLPELTEERRREMVKQAKHRAEEARIAIRNLRRSGNDHIRALGKEEHVSEDQVKDGLERMQNLTDKYISEIGTALAGKEKDIMTI